jgi:hypothetical protein
VLRGIFAEGESSCGVNMCAVLYTLLSGASMVGCLGVLLVWL